ncbi:sulfate transporter family-domain-containing protein [Morchella snyderi]|nr:sulfate transporter family-domain-containing protein [Morchella snyderi]
MTDSPMSSKIGHGLAKALGIDLTPAVLARNPPVDIPKELGSIRSTSSDAYIEEEPTVIEWIGEFKPTAPGAVEYVSSLFPFISWIHRYNFKWLYGDLVAGITVGCVVIPQGMAYAKLANLPVEFGLYSSFVGVMIYWFFATSKDITIGPVAVMSTLVGNIVANSPELPAQAVASGLALVAGGIVTALGLLRLGFVVEYIPLTAIAAFMTGSAISIAAGQVSSLMGMSGFNTRGPTYLVIINSLKHLPSTKIDAAMGLSALFLLYLLRWFTTGFLTKKYPRQQKTWFFLATLRTAFVILLYTMISWLVNRSRRTHPRFKILQKVPSGFQHMGVPVVNAEIFASFRAELPATVIVMLIEHIAISKSFGRINNYTINPSQEMIAIGITNIFGPFFGGYPATGSFSRTAIKSKAGVRTPFAGVITGVVVLLAIYLLTSVFYYIPNSSLSAVIIHAVGDLITPPNTVYKFWLVSPLEVIIFFAGVFVTIFSTIENGIYVTVAVSAAVLLFRIAKAKGHFLGRVKIHSMAGDYLLGGGSDEDLRQSEDSPRGNSFPSDIKRSSAKKPLRRSLDLTSSRNVFLPLDHKDGSNPGIEVVSPYPGVFIYRFSEGFVYSNAAHYTEYLVTHIFEVTRPTNPALMPEPGDRPWNDPGPKKGTVVAADTRPTLKAIILDFSSVNNVDITSVQNLIDVRNQLDRHASPEKVEWHFAAVSNRWTKRALAAGGFGFPTEEFKAGKKGWTPVFSVAESADFPAGEIDDEKKGFDEEAGKPLTSESTRSSDEVGQASPGVLAPSGLRRKVLGSVKRPFFHPDIDGALQSVIRSIEG